MMPSSNALYRSKASPNAQRTKSETIFISQPKRLLSAHSQTRVAKVQCTAKSVARMDGIPVKPVVGSVRSVGRAPARSWNTISFWSAHQVASSESFAPKPILDG